MCNFSNYLSYERKAPFIILNKTSKKPVNDLDCLQILETKFLNLTHLFIAVPFML